MDDFNLNGCRIIPTIEKLKNREIAKRHYQHKEEKLRQRIYKKAKEEKQLAKEMKEVEKEERENFVFRLAEESLAASECDANENENVATKKFPLTYKRFDYPMSELELLEFQRQLCEKSLDEVKKDKLLAPTALNDANDGGEENGITCGQKIGNRVILRGFHDRLCTEPRGEKNYYHLKKSGTGTTCLTHSQWLDTLTNDAEILVSEKEC